MNRRKRSTFRRGRSTDSYLSTLAWRGHTDQQQRAVRIEQAASFLARLLPKRAA